MTTRSRSILDRVVVKKENGLARLAQDVLSVPLHPCVLQRISMLQPAASTITALILCFSSVQTTDVCNHGSALTCTPKGFLIVHLTLSVANHVCLPEAEAAGGLAGSAAAGAGASGVCVCVCVFVVSGIPPRKPSVGAVCSVLQPRHAWADLDRGRGIACPFAAHRRMSEELVGPIHTRPFVLITLGGGSRELLRLSNLL